MVSGGKACFKGKNGKQKKGWRSFTVMGEKGVTYYQQCEYLLNSMSYGRELPCHLPPTLKALSALVFGDLECLVRNK